MSSPIRINSELLESIKKSIADSFHNTGNNDSTITGAIAALDSKLTTLIARVNGIENSMNGTTDPIGSNESDADTSDAIKVNGECHTAVLSEYSVCVVRGEAVLTTTINAGDAISLYTFNDVEDLPVEGTGFVGVANAYKSSANTSEEPIQMALVIENKSLHAIAESKITASSSESYFISYNTMWITRKYGTNSGFRNIGWKDPNVGGYVYSVSKGGVCFVCGYSDDVADGFYQTDRKAHV